MMKKIFFRLGVTMMLTEEEFALIRTSNDAAHDLLRSKAEQGEFILDGETYSPADLSPGENGFYHRDDIEFEF